MKALFPLFVLLVATACRPPLATAAAVAAEVMTPAPALLSAVVMHADDARREALATADPKPLDLYFGGRSLLSLRLQVAGLATRGLRRVERLLSRRLVHQGGAPGQPEAVLEVRAQVQAGGGWATVLRQWRVQLGRQGGAWLVTDDQDLPPVAWWR
ncbi:MAG TPA: hypothetical protein VF160_13645 [Candidatus Dormibacteraeota bacterium]